MRFSNAYALQSNLLYVLGGKMVDLESRLNDYLKQYFHVSLFALNEDVPPVPMQFKNKVKIVLGKLGGLTFHVVYTYDDIIFAPTNGYLFDKLLKRLDEYPVMFVADELKRSTILQLTEKRVAHVIPFERSYIPELLLHQEKPPKENVKTFPKKRLGILPTNIIARYLDGVIPRTFATSDIQLNVSKTSISRSIKELQDCGLIEAEKIGRSYKMKFLYNRQKIWEARDYLLADLASDVYQVPRNFIEGPNVLAGESALSKYTLLSPPKVPCYAIMMDNDSRRSFAITSNTINKISEYFLKEQRQDWEKFQEHIELQVFPYEPTTEQRRDGNMISAIMLSLSGYKNKEPRIRTSFEELDDIIYEKLARLDLQDFD